jgi:flagellar biosynthesis/type III secretory pathway chaperone
MADDMIELMTSLTMVLTEESAQLRRQTTNGELRELASVKNRLVGMLQYELAQRERLDPDWAAQIDDEKREVLSRVVKTLAEASAANRAVLQRQLELTTDMIDALAQEARRTSGRRASTYQADGDLTPLDLAPPISINSHY